MHGWYLRDSSQFLVPKFMASASINTRMINTRLGDGYAPLLLEALVALTLPFTSFQTQALFRVDAEFVAQKLRARKRHILVFKAKFYRHEA